MNTARRYKGWHIYECERIKGEHRGKWIIQTYHSTGVAWTDELCPHYHSLAAAKYAINSQPDFMKDPA